MENIEERVKLKLECFDKELHATLKINESELPHLEVDLLSKSFLESITLSDSENKAIVCKSETCKYLLLQNETTRNTIWPMYVVQGEDDPCFSGVEVLISGLSEWIDQKTHFDITELEIRKERPKTAFDEIFEIDGKRYQIRSNYNCKIKNQNNRDFLVSETTTINIVSMDELISVDKAERLAHDVRKFFSLLLAAPLAIESAWLVDNEGINRRPFYFLLPKFDFRPFKYPKECLIAPIQIADRIGWRKLLLNYFSAPIRNNFKEIWGRLTSVFSYDGFWEYEFLGYVSVLDSYCEKYTNKKSKRLTKDRYKSLKDDLLVVVDKHNKDLGPEYAEVITSFKDGIDSIRNTNLPTFKNKFDYMMKDIDADIYKVINISEEEFSTIKQIRNSAAHGLPIQTRNGRDMSYEARVKNKLLVLLIYLVYRDFGVTPIEFALSLKRTLCEFVRGANINTIERDRLAGTVPFWNVDKDSLQSIKLTKKTYIGIEYFEYSNTFRYSQPITDACQNWITHACKDYSRILIDHVRERLSFSNEIEIEFVNQAYVVNGDEAIKISAVCEVIHK